MIKEIKIPQLEPAQGIQAAFEKLFLWNPDVAARLIAEIQSALESAETNAAAAQSSAAAAAQYDSEMRGRMEAAVEQLEDYVATHAKTFTFDMPTEQTDWTINHNLDKYPSVTVVDTAGTVVEVEVKYINSNTVVLHADVPFAGTAYLNYGGITDVGLGLDCGGVTETPTDKFDMGTIN